MASSAMSGLPVVLSPLMNTTELVSTPAIPKQRSILLLVDQLCELGGGERTVFQLARLLPRHGYRVFVVTFRGEPDQEAFRLCENITVLAMNAVFSLRALQVAHQLRAMIHREEVEIVQTFFESADTFGAVVARLAGVRHVVSSRRDMGILRTPKHSRAYRILGRYYAAVLTVSHQVRKWHMDADGLDPRQLHVIHNGLSLEGFKVPSPRLQTRIFRQATLWHHGRSL